MLTRFDFNSLLQRVMQQGQFSTKDQYITKTIQWNTFFYKHNNDTLQYLQIKYSCRSLCPKKKSMLAINVNKTIDIYSAFCIDHTYHTKYLMCLRSMQSKGIFKPRYIRTDYKEDQGGSFYQGANPLLEPSQKMGGIRFVTSCLPMCNICKSCTCNCASVSMDCEIGQHPLWSGR